MCFADVLVAVGIECTLMTRLRGLSALRLSVLTDETTSIGTQRGANQRAADALDIDLGDREAEDLDVSALKYSPFERPQLGAWLKRPQEFDAIIWWRFDRAIASMADMHALATWAREQRKMLVFSEGVGGAGRLVVDYRNPQDPMAELMLTMFAFAAQVERVSTSDRVTSMHAALRKMPLRWKGGRPPYGYRPVEITGGVGKTLVQDPASVAVLRRIISELLGNPLATVTGTAVSLTDERIPTPWARLGGKGTDGSEVWSGAAVKRILLAPAILGHKTFQGRTLRTPEGDPIPFTSDPILTREEYDRVRARLTGKPTKSVVRRKDATPLLGIVFCASCKGKMYRVPGTATLRYVCRNARHKLRCPAPASVRADRIEEFTAEEFLRRFGAIGSVELVDVPGYDPGPEIEEVQAEYQEHLTLAGRMKSEIAKREWQRHAEALDARLAVLEGAERVEGKTERVPTGKTLREEWGAAESVAQEREILLRCGIRVEVRSVGRGAKLSVDERVTLWTEDEELREAAEAGSEEG